MSSVDESLLDKYLYIAGSANEKCDVETLHQTRSFVEALIRTWIDRGGRLLTFLGREPRIREDDPSTSLTFDWFALETLTNLSLEAGERCTAILSSETQKRRFPADRLGILESLVSSGALSLQFYDEDRHVGGFIRERLSELADAVIAIGGGKGVLDLHDKCSRLHTPVLPFTFAIGASCDDGEGAVKLCRLAASAPSDFFSGTPERLKHALVTLPILVEKDVEQAVKSTVALLSDEFAALKETKKVEQAIDGNVRMLLVISNPTDTDPLDLDAEGMRILQFLLDGAASDKLSVKIMREATPVSLRSKLASFKPSILHFAGHGYNQGIVLQEKTGAAVCVDIETLAQLLNVFKDEIRLVVLNSCSSSESARRLSQTIDFVIGMKADVDDDTAIAFSEGFFDGIANQCSVQQAFDLGIANCKLMKAPSPQLPILHVRAAADARMAILR